MDELIQKIRKHFSVQEETEILRLLERIDCNDHESKTLKHAIVDMSDGEIKTLRFYIKHAKKKKEEILTAYSQWLEYQRTKNNIRIGENEWIQWVEIDVFKAPIRDIDELLKPLKPFWDAIELNCEKRCCGIEAFRLFPETIKEVSLKLNDKNLKQNFDILLVETDNTKEPIIGSTYLNQYFEKSVFKKLVVHIIQHL